MYSRAILLERIQLAALRGGAAALAVYVSVGLWHALPIGDGTTPWSIYRLPTLIVAGSTMLVMWKVPAIDYGSRRLGTVWMITKRVGLVMMMMLAISFFYRADSYSRGTFIVFIPVSIIALYAAARLHLALLTLVVRNEDATRRVIIVGSGVHASRIASALSHQPAFYTVIGYVDDGADSGNGSLGATQRLGGLSDLEATLAGSRVDEVMLALSAGKTREIQELIGICMAHQVVWKVVPPMLDLVLDHVAFEYVDGLPLIGQRGSRLVGYNWYAKRAFDIAVSGLALLVLSPILGIAALAVRLTSRGPVVFRQQRLGLHGNPFTLYKFRTMYVDTGTETHEAATAEWILGREIEPDASGNGDGGLHKIRADDRITTVGRLLRLTSIDELPQLWNVLKGDMSLVGPRPPIGYEVDRYSEWHKRRLEVPPGVTGLWQVSGRNRLSFEEMVDLDIDYIEHWSFGRDIEILLKTIPAVVSDRGY